MPAAAANMQPKTKGLNLVVAFLGIIVTWDSGNRGNGSYEVHR